MLTLPSVQSVYKSIQYTYLLRRVDLDNSVYLILLLICCCFHVLWLIALAKQTTCIRERKRERERERDREIEKKRERRFPMYCVLLEND